MARTSKEIYEQLTKKQRTGDVAFKQSASTSINNLPDELLVEILNLRNPTLQELVQLGSVSKRWYAITRDPVILKPVLAQLSEEKIESFIFKVSEPKILNFILSQLSDERIFSLFEKTANEFRKIIDIIQTEYPDEKVTEGISEFYSETLPELQKKIEILLQDERIKIDIKFGTEQQTLCHLAADLNLSELISWLQENGSDLNTTNKDRETPLHVALRNLLLPEEYKCAERFKTARELLNYNVNVNAKTESNITPLHYLAQFDSVDQLSKEERQDFKQFLDELYEKGADFLAEESQTKSAPWQLAASKGNLKINSWLNKLTRKQIKKEQQEKDDAYFQELEASDLLNGLKSNH